jgi:FdrA protein
MRGLRLRYVETRPGLYRDSVQLMQISSSLARLSGVDSVLVAMATELNLDLAGELGFEVPRASANDMLVAIVADDEATLAATLHQLETQLAGTGEGVPGTETALTPRTVHAAVRAAGGPSVVLVSTPGRYAFVEAMDALDAGASVMVFSDNVPVTEEVCLKRTANQRGLLVMGPDCGTAVIAGVGLGFANVVRPGPVGLVSASGTGAQHVMSLLSLAGVGISHCLGVGGRDLSAAVGGLSTEVALSILDKDPATELIVVLSKPPDPEVASAVRRHAEHLATPVLFAPLGPQAPDLTTVVEQVLHRLEVPVPIWPTWGTAAEPRTPGRLRGLFSGGTLCAEAMLVAADPAYPMVDLGADEYTLGRPHPMIDYEPRLALLAAAAADPGCRVVLLDVVLGHAAHPNPAADLAPALASLGSDLQAVVSLIGTADDPQGLDRQATALAEAGAAVFSSNAAAARYAARLANGAS